MKIIFFLLTLSVIPPAIKTAGRNVIVFQNPNRVPEVSSVSWGTSALISKPLVLSLTPANPYASLIKFLDQLKDMSTSDYKNKQV